MNKKKSGRQLASFVTMLSSAAILTTPILAFAAQDTSSVCRGVTSTGLTGLFSCMSGLVGSMITIVEILAFLFFFWGVMLYIKNANDQKAREEGRWFMIYGIGAIFVIYAVWGLITVLDSTFGISTQDPQFNTSTSNSGYADRLKYFNYGDSGY